MSEPFSFIRLERQFPVGCAVRMTTAALADVPEDWLGTAYVIGYDFHRRGDQIVPMLRLSWVRGGSGADIILLASEVERIPEQADAAGEQP